MIKKLNSFIGFILASKLMMWAVPDSKRFIKGIVITAAVILLTMYFHSEYLGWAEISGNISFISTSYILKNLIILISLLFFYFYIRKPKKITTSRVKGEDKIYTSYTGDAYFDKFRNKEKLKTKAEQILEKDDKDD